MVAFIKGNTEIENAIKQIDDIHKESEDFLQFQYQRVQSMLKPYQERRNNAWTNLANVLAAQGAIAEGEYRPSRDALGIAREANAVWFEKDGQQQTSQGSVGSIGGIGIPVPDGLIQGLLSKLFKD